MHRRTFLKVLSVGILAAASVLAAPPVATKVVARGENSLAVVDVTSGRTLHTLPKPAGLLREMYALDGGNVIATSQKDFTDFWGANDGKQVRRLDERIYAFSHDQNSFVTFTAERRLLVRKYPGLTVKYELLNEVRGGPSNLVFSPDDRFLAVEFCNVYPLSDELFLHPDFNMAEYWVVVFDMTNSSRISDVEDAMLGRFSEDSRTYTRSSDSRRYDLISKAWQDSTNR